MVSQGRASKLYSLRQGAHRFSSILTFRKQNKQMFAAPVQNPFVRFMLCTKCSEIKSCILKCTTPITQHTLKLQNAHKTLTPSLWAVLVFAVVTLTILNILISLKLTHLMVTDRVASGTHWNDSQTTRVNCCTSPWFVECSSTPLDACVPSFNTTKEGRANSLHFVNMTGRFDNSRKYRIHDFVQIADQWSYLSTHRSVCLATQTSVDRMDWIAEVSSNWQGSISVAVFVPGEDFDVAVHFVDYLRRCSSSVRSYVSFHFVYPVQRLPVTLPSTKFANLSCGLSETSALKTLLHLRPRIMQNWRNLLLYPQNHLRNVARKGCPSTYVYLTDVDIVPRRGLAKSLHEFLKYPSCEHCAFVVPTYEVDEKATIPLNKSELLQLVQKKKAQPFHKIVFINNQFATNASEWERLPEGQGITVAYPVSNFELFYEPFYVSRDDVPPHDERFVGYGFTRNTQVYEMFVANFKFVVLNYAFAVHRGLKRKKTKNSWREKQNRANSRLFKRFEREVLARHGYSVGLDKKQHKQ